MDISFRETGAKVGKTEGIDVEGNEWEWQKCWREG